MYKNYDYSKCLSLTKKMYKKFLESRQISKIFVTLKRINKYEVNRSKIEQLNQLLQKKSKCCTIQIKNIYR